MFGLSVICLVFASVFILLYPKYIQMKIRINICLISVVILFSCCTRQQSFSPELCTIDSLLNIENNNEALNLLEKINKNKLGDADMAYYWLLQNIAIHHLDSCVSGESNIQKAVNYFEQVNNKYMLSRSLLYQGLTYMKQDKLKEAVLCLKQAESIVTTVNEDNLSTEVGKNIAYLNAVVGNYQLSSTQAQKILKRAKEIGDDKSVGFCYHLLSVDYNHRGNKDSNDYYQVKTFPYIDTQPDRIRYRLYFNAATFLWRKGDYKQAELYFKKSLNVKQWDLAYGALAELLIEQGRINETDSLWAKAFTTDDKGNKAKMMWAYSKWLWAQDRKQEAWDIAIQIPLLKDSIAHQQQAEELQLVQSGYEHQLAEMQQHSRMQQMVIYGLCIVLVMALAGFLLWRKLQKTRQRLAESQKETEAYTLRLRMEQEEIEKLKHEQHLLESSKKRSEKEHQEQESALNRRIRDKERRVKDLQHKLQSLRDEQGAMLAHGKRLYESIMQGGNTNGWRKADYVDFTNCYRLDHFDFFEGQDDNWENMTPREQFLMILHDIGLEKVQILFAMGISKGTYRTMLSRMASKYEVK